MGKLEKLFFLLHISAISALQFYAFQFQGISAWLLLSALPAVLLHIVAILLPENAIQKYLMFFGYSVLLCGPFSTLGCFIILLTQIRPSKTLLNEYRDFLVTDVEMSPLDNIEQNLSIDYWNEESGQITPFIEIMYGNNSDKKRDTINKVVQHPSIRSKSILEIGLKDNDQDIRFYAASAIIMLNDNFIDKFKDYLERIKTSPDDEKLYLKLAISYDKYCSWNLPEKEDLPGYYKKIEHAFRKVLSLSPKNFQAILGLGKVLINTKRFVEAEEVLSNGLKLYPNSHKLAFFKLEALYNQKQFDKVQTMANEISDNFLHLNLEVEEVIKYWKNV